MQVATGLAARGDTFEVLAVGRCGQPYKESIDGVEIQRLSTRIVNYRHRLTHLFRIGVFFFRCMLVLTIRHIKRPYDVVHVQSVPDFLVLQQQLPN